MTKRNNETQKLDGNRNNKTNSKAEGIASIQRMEWKINVPIFRDPAILKQLGLAIGLPFGLVILIIALVSWGSRDSLYALGLIAGLMVLSWLFIMVVYRGRYEAEFILDQKGALCRTQLEQARKNRIINGLTVALGIFSRTPAAAGAGLLAQSRQSMMIPWKRITKARYRPKNRTILLRGGWTENIALFCTEENYSKAEELVLAMTTHLREN